MAVKTYITISANDTKKLAKKLAKKFKSGVIALTGELGAGKTTFVQGFAQGVGIKERIISPTFVLIRQHQIPNTKKLLYHIDLYRLEKKYEFNQLGLEDLLNDSNHLILIEWAEKIMDLLPKDAVKINLQVVDSSTRKITISNLF